MNILSLFDGMSCGRIALDRAGITVDKYYASEIDKHAIKVSKDNYPDIIQLGDVTRIDTSKLPKIDLLIGGSPCQGFSFSGKGLAFDDPRSALFFEFVRIKNELEIINPNLLFLLENVKMKKQHQAVITEYMGVEPIEINSALVSAQNRKRLYWTNIGGTVEIDLFGTKQSVIPQPEDKGILLRDILEDEVDEKYYMSDKMINYFKTRAANFNNGRVNIREVGGKATTLTQSIASCDISDNFIKVDTSLKVSKDQDKANTFTAGGNSGGLHSDMTLIVASRGRNPENPKSRQAGLPTEQHLEPRSDGRTNCLTSVAKDNLVMQLNLSKESGGKQPYQQNRVYSADGISPSLQAELSTGSPKILIDDFRIRRLTPLECERLQTVPDNFTASVSDTQRYKMLGNGWTIDVITHILKHI